VETEVAASGNVIHSVSPLNERKGQQKEIFFD